MGFAWAIQQIKAHGRRPGIRQYWRMVSKEIEGSGMKTTVQLLNLKTVHPQIRLHTGTYKGLLTLSLYAYKDIPRLRKLW